MPIRYKHPDADNTTVITSDEITELYVLPHHGNYDDNPEFLAKYGTRNSPANVVRDSAVGIAFWIEDVQEVQLYTRDPNNHRVMKNVNLDCFTAEHWADLCQAVATHTAQHNDPYAAGLKW